MGHRIFVNLVGLVPAGVQFGLSDRLFQEGQRPVLAEGPRPDQGLVEHPLRGRVGQVGHPVATVEVVPALHGRRPFVRASRTGPTCGPSRPRSAWCRGWKWPTGHWGCRAWVCCAPGVEILHRVPGTPGSPPTSLRGSRAAPTVKGSVFYCFGHDRAGELLEAQGHFHFGRARLFPATGLGAGTTTARRPVRGGAGPPRATARRHALDVCWDGWPPARTYVR